MRLLSTLTAFTLATAIAAQCPFTPTIEQTGIILCPFTSAELTTQACDSYQWYKQGVPIPGATQQTLTVSFQTGAGYRFQVEGTLNGCTAISEQVLVDGWAFPTLMVYAGGDPPRAVENGGLMRYCAGDTATLNLNAPYTASITWFRDGVPVPGAHSPTLVITGSGSYTAWAAPGLCPELVFSLDVSVTLVFDVPEPPTILNLGGVLCASPFSNAYSWFLNGLPDAIDVGTCHEPLQPGAYTAQIISGTVCTAPSAPYLHLPTGLSEHRAPGAFTVHVQAGNLLVQRAPDAAHIRNWRMLDLQGRTVREGQFPSDDQLEVPLTGLSSGAFLFQPLAAGDAAAPATRFMLAQ